MNKKQLEKIRMCMSIPDEIKTVLDDCKGCDYSDYHEEDNHGYYATGLFRYKGKDILITRDNGRWHLSASTDHPIGYYELKEVRYEFLPNDINVAQIFPPRDQFVNLAENCYHLWEINDDGRSLTGLMPSYEDLVEQSAKKVTGEDLKFKHFETSRKVFKAMCETMMDEGIDRSELPQMLHDFCKFVILAEANADEENALFVIRRFTELTADLSALMMRIVIKNVDMPEGRQEKSDNE